MMQKLRKSDSNQEAAINLTDKLQSWLAETDPVSLWQTCATCLFLGKDDRTCSKFGKQPPVSVVVKGCDFYDDNYDIPF